MLIAEFGNEAPKSPLGFGSGDDKNEILERVREWKGLKPIGND